MIHMSIYFNAFSFEFKIILFYHNIKSFKSIFFTNIKKFKSWILVNLEVDLEHENYIFVFFNKVFVNFTSFT